jgi:ABC-type bacteriocin/lantibiotic exporter with double-glycine peptidase domain
MPTDSTLTLVVLALLVVVGAILVADLIVCARRVRRATERERWRDG